MPRNTLRFTCASCGHDHTLDQIRRSLYIGQRALGDYQAARRGTLGRRLGRRYATRAIRRALFR